MAPLPSQITSFQPTGFARFPDKRLTANQPYNTSFDVNALATTVSVNRMAAYLQGSSMASYYTDARLLTMTANDMIYAIRQILYPADI